MSLALLDNVEAIKKADKYGIVNAAELLWKQCEQAFAETQAIRLPKDYKNITRAVVCGMGGSHLGAQIIKSVYETSLKVPLIIQNEYDIPGYIGPDTLVIATSYSGNTEEVLSFTKQALTRKAKIICISSGGKLAQFASDHNLPRYIFESKYNPSKIPRYGSGYLFISQMEFLSKVGVISIAEKDIQDIIKILKKQVGKYGLSIETTKNQAKQLALDCKDAIVILVASQHLSGPAYIFKNMINESAKNLSALFKIPELNHHLLEGLEYPKQNRKVLRFVFFNSNLYHKRNQQRYTITREVVSKQGIPVSQFFPDSASKLTQAFETIEFASYASLYLAVLNNKIDSKPNPWVDYLKERLK